MNNMINISEDIFKIDREQKSGLELISENATLHSVLDNLTEGIIVADKNGRFTFFNSAAQSILGIGPKDISPAEWTSVYGCYYPDDFTPFPSEKLPLALAIKGEEIIDEIIFIQNPKQSKGVYISVSASPVRDSGGIVNGGVVLLRDITEHQLSEIALKQSTQKFKSLFKGFPIPSYVWQHTDKGFIFMDYNEAAEAYSKHSISNLLGKKLIEVYSDSPNIDYIQSDINKCFNTKRNISRKRPYKLLNTGETRELIFNYVFIYPDYIMIHTEDVTDQKKSLTKLKILSNAIEQTADSVVITDTKGKIEYVNPAFESTTGYSSHEAVGKTPRMLKSGKHDEEFYKKLWNEIMRGSTYRGTIVNKKKNGEFYLSQQTITPMKDEYGDIKNYVSVLRDITELKKQQEQEFQLQIVNELQQNLLKTEISLPGYDIAGASYPAVKANGDYLDFIEMKNGSIGIVIADVCGHGIGAAIIMAETRAYLKIIAQTENDPGNILTHINKELAVDLDINHFVTLIFGRLDPKTNSFVYANAGHLPIYLLDETGNVKQTMMSNGIPLGIVGDFKYITSEEVVLQTKDILVFLTDGIVEAKTDEEIELGLEGALEIIKRYQYLGSKQIIENIYNEVKTFTNNQIQEDDITSIICKLEKG